MSTPKFNNDNVTEVLYMAAMDASEVYSLEDWGDSASLIDSPLTNEEIDRILQECDITITDEERAQLTTMAGAIVYSSGSGMVSYEGFTTEEKLLNQWAAIESDYYHDEDEDEDPFDDEDELEAGEEDENIEKVENLNEVGFFNLAIEKKFWYEMNISPDYNRIFYLFKPSLVELFDFCTVADRKFENEIRFMMGAVVMTDRDNKILYTKVCETQNILIDTWGRAIKYGVDEIKD